MSIDPRRFYESLVAQGAGLFAGVPDSLLTAFSACVEDLSPPGGHIIAANEGGAVALAAGSYLATGRPGVVYMQNSGLGNAVNPLVSLADQAVYGIPMLLVVGWRGEPGVPDEPQHAAQGRATGPLLDALGLEWEVLDPARWEAQTASLMAGLRRESRPAALVARKGAFAPYPLVLPSAGLPLTREDALAALMEAAPRDAVLVATTGKTSREVFELRERRGEGHDQDFLTVGSMGHTASIAIGLALGTSRPVYCLDGDGSCLMHLGSLAVGAQNWPDNLVYVLLNNGAHESVGGQPTVGFAADLPAALRAFGFERVSTVRDAASLRRAVAEARPGRVAIAVELRQGSRPDLGRPTTTPAQNKADLMRLLAG